MRKMKIGLGFLLAAVMLVGMTGVGWGMGGSPPPLINFQGRLINLSDGRPVVGTTTVRFSFYDNENVGSGTKLPSGAPWEETYTATELGIDENGVVNAVLGSKVAIPYSSIFMLNAPVYLNVEVGGETLRAAGNKRQRMVATPYAFTAHSVNGSENIVYASQSGGGFPAVTGMKPSTSGDSTAGVLGRNERTTPDDNPGVKGESVSGYGVYGENTTSNTSGRLGTNTTGVFGLIPGTDTSTNKIAILGRNYSTGSGDNPGVKGESTKGYGVYGVSTDGTAILGQITNTLNFNPAIKGISSYGHGTYGPLGYGAGVYGENTASTAGGPGVRGGSASGDGVRGVSSASGVGAAAGVYGWNQAEANGGPGVFGSSRSGIGVEGTSGSTTLAGVKAVNTANGPALEIGTGKIKTVKGRQTATAGSTITCNGHSGQVVVNTDTDTARDNIYIKNDQIDKTNPERSIVLVTLARPIGTHADTKILNINYFTGTDTGGFTVYFDRDLDGQVYVNFLVIN